MFGKLSQGNKSVRYRLLSETTMDIIRFGLFLVVGEGAGKIKLSIEINTQSNTITIKAQ